MDFNSYGYAKRAKQVYPNLTKSIGDRIII